MSELAALRKLAFTSPKACARVHRRGGGTDEGIAQVLSSAGILAAIIAAAHGLTADAVARLVAPLITADPAPDVTPADIEHVRFMNQHG